MLYTCDLNQYYKYRYFSCDWNKEILVTQNTLIPVYYYEIILVNFLNTQMQLVISYKNRFKTKFYKLFEIKKI